MKYFKFSILILLLIFITNCTREKSKINIEICNKTLHKITDISLTYNKEIENIPFVASGNCTKVKLKNIISESGLSIKYLQNNKYIKHDINIYFEEFSYEGIIKIILHEKNIDVSNNLRIN